MPKNFDQDWHGTVTIRMALAQSLNIPAVKVLDALGAQKLFGRLAQVGITPVLPKGAEPSLAIALGGLGMKLSDLATLYAGLARGGEPVALQYRRDGAEPKPARRPARGCCRRWPPGTSPTSCATRRRRPTPSPARSPTRPAPPTASATPGRWATTAATPSPCGSAGPMAPPRRASPAAPPPRRCCSTPSPASRRRRTPLGPAPSGALVVAGTDLPPPLKRFREAKEDPRSDPGAYLEPAVQIAFPPDRSELDVEDGDGASVVVKAEGGALPLTWLVDGVPIDIRSRPPRGRAAGRRPRLPQALRHRRQGPRRPRDRSG